MCNLFPIHIFLLAVVLMSSHIKGKWFQRSKKSSFSSAAYLTWYFENWRWLHMTRWFRLPFGKWCTDCFSCGSWNELWCLFIQVKAMNLTKEEGWLSYRLDGDGIEQLVKLGEHWNRGHIRFYLYICVYRFIAIERTLCSLGDFLVARFLGK